jgi:hypothetical protein
MKNDRIASTGNANRGGDTHRLLLNVRPSPEHWQVSCRLRRLCGSKMRLAAAVNGVAGILVFEMLLYQQERKNVPGKRLSALAPYIANNASVQPRGADVVEVKKNTCLSWSLLQVLLQTQDVLYPVLISDCKNLHAGCDSWKWDPPSNARFRSRRPLSAPFPIPAAEALGTNPTQPA